MKNAFVQKAMLERVAQALGDELLEDIVFVGGCTTGLLVTDEFVLEDVRHTHDVDLIVNVMGLVRYQRLRDQLKERGFKEPGVHDDMPTCAMKLGELRVDLMPDDASILTFTNQWYLKAIDSAEKHALTDSLSIKVVSPVYFLATKLEAYRGRGNGDPVESQDIEDILNLVDGREELLDEVARAPTLVRQFISDEITHLLEHQGGAFGWAIQSQAAGAERQAILYQRLNTLAGR